jgi:ribosome-binding factor A
MTKRRRGRAPAGPREYPRTARLNQLLQEIIADELERIDDDRLELVTIMSVEVDADLNRALVYFDSLEGEAGDESVLAALGERRPRLQAAVNAQARMRRTPELVFRPDEVLRGANRVDDILRRIDHPDDVDHPRDPDDPSGA